MAIKKQRFPHTISQKICEQETNPKKPSCNTLRKSSPMALLRKRIENNEDTSAQVKIGDWYFDCHLVVLQSYSELIRRHPFGHGSIIELPEEQVSSKTFLMIYRWMIEDKPYVARPGVVDLLVSACYLEIEQLITQIWACINDEGLPSDAAFFLYVEASVLNVKCLKELMLKKISNFFLIFVAFREFLLMPIDDLCTLIRCDTIGVNTEIEVFMAAIRWLSFDWYKRQKYISSVMRRVRFCLIPPGFLIELDRNMIKNCIIKLVMGQKKVRDLVRSGLKYATTRLCYGKCIKQKSSVKERQWIYDKNCEYHIDMNHLIEYRATYEKFILYLKYLQTCKQNYSQSFENIGKVSISACSSEINQKENLEMAKESSNIHAIPEISDDQDSTAWTTDSSSDESSSTSQDVSSAVDNSRSSAAEEVKPLDNVILQLKKGLDEILHQGVLGNKELTYRTEASSIEVSSSENLSDHSKTETSDNDSSSSSSSSSSMVNEKDIAQKSKSSPILNSNKCTMCQSAAKEQDPIQTIMKIDEKATSSSSVTSNTSSSVVIFSKNLLPRSKFKESSSLHVSGIDSTPQPQPYSQQNLCMSSKESDKKKGNSPERPSVAAHHHRFEFKPIELDQILSRLTIFSRKSSSNFDTSMDNNPSMAGKKRTAQAKIKYNARDQGAGDAPILISSIEIDNKFEMAKMLFKNKTLLILGGNDPYHQHGNKPSHYIDKILFYSSRFHEWAQTPHTSFCTRQHHGAVVCNGVVYIIGGTKVIPGCKNTYFETSIWALNGKTKTWTRETNLPRNRRDFGVVAVEGELNEPGFYVIGGESFDRVPLDSVWFYNISKKLWLRKAPLNSPRYGFSAAKVNNEIWIAGGITCSTNNFLYSTDRTETITDSIEIFKIHEALNTNKGNWINSKYRLPRRCLFGRIISTPDNKQLYLVGGIGLDKNTNDLNSFNAIDRFDFKAEMWVQCGKLTNERHGHSVVVIGDFLAIIGGVSAKKKHALKSIEFFCMQTSQIFKPIPDLPRPLSGLATAVVDGEW